MEHRLIEVAKRLEKHHQRGSDLEAELVTLMNAVAMPAVHVAKTIGVSPQYLSDVKKGRRTVSRDLVKRIASVTVKCEGEGRPEVSQSTKP